MPLLRDGQIIETDPWTMHDDETALPAECKHLIVSLERYLELADTKGQPLPGGIKVAPDDNVLELAPHVSQLNLICIDFPVFTDGRGFTHARLLRKRLGYERELRAVCDVRADQVLFMARSGIDSFDFPTQPDTSLLQTLTTRYQKNYQPSYPLPASV